MRILIWIIRITVIFLLLWFAAKNSELVTLNGYLDASIRAPLILILLFFFAAGLLLGLLASLMTIFNLKREVRKLNRQLQRKTHEELTALPPESVKRHDY